MSLTLKNSLPSILEENLLLLKTEIFYYIQIKNYKFSAWTRTQLNTTYLTELAFHSVCLFSLVCRLATSEFWVLGTIFSWLHI